MLRSLAALAVGLALTGGAAAQTDCSANGNRVATLVFPSSLNAADLPISDGALLRATDPRGGCVGEIVWSEAEGRAMVLRGSDPEQTSPDGLLDGEDVTLSVIEDGAGAPLSVSATDVGGDSVGDLTFHSGELYLVSTLSIPVGTGDTPPRGPLLTVDPLAPNPATQSTTLRYRLSTAASVACEVFDTLGRRLIQGHPTERAAGEHAHPLDVTNLTAGVYLARLTVHGPAAATTAARRFTVTR